MKGKILLSVLFSLILAFGMLVASCDNGVYPDKPTDANKTVQDYIPPEALPEAYQDFENNATGEKGGDGLPDSVASQGGWGKLLTAAEVGTYLAKNDADDDDKDWYMDPKTTEVYYITYVLAKATSGYQKGNVILTAKLNKP